MDWVLTYGLAIAALCFGIFFPWGKYPKVKLILVAAIVIGGLGRALL